MFKSFMAAVAAAVMISAGDVYKRQDVYSRITRISRAASLGLIGNTPVSICSGR